MANKMKEDTRMVGIDVAVLLFYVSYTLTVSRTVNVMERLQEFELLRREGKFGEDYFKYKQEA